MDSDERREKILTIEAEFMKTAENLQSYLDELRNTHRQIVQEGLEIRTEIKNRLSNSDGSRQNSLEIIGILEIIQQEHIQSIDDLKEDNKKILTSINSIELRFTEIITQIEEIHTNFFNQTKFNDEVRDRVNQLFLDISAISTSQRKIENTIQEIQHNLSENNGISNDFQNLLSLVRDIDQHLNQLSSITEKTVLDLVSFENKLKLINDRFERFENFSATHFTEISDQIINGFNQATTTKDNYLLNFEEVHRTLTSDIATNQEIINRLSHIYGNNITILAKNIDTILAKLETQNRAIQEINSIYQDNISRLDKMNYKVRRQNAILMVLVVIFIALSVIIAVAFK